MRRLTSLRYVGPRGWSGTALVEVLPSLETPDGRAQARFALDDGGELVFNLEELLQALDTQD